jgi:acetylxylan esterase
MLGAHVVGDAVCGGGGAPNLGPETPALDKKYADKIVAMIQMGDPRFVSKKSFDKGTAMMNGVSYSMTLTLALG